MYELTKHRASMARTVGGAAVLFALLTLGAAAAAFAVPGDTILISRQSDAAGGAGADAPSSGRRQTVSADGRYVVFDSSATNLSDVDDDRLGDIFVRDTATGTTTLVSRQSAAKGGAPADDHSFEPVISANGRFVVFDSDARNLSRRRRGVNLYLRDLRRERTVPVARGEGATISGNGRYLAFVSAAPGGRRKAVVRDMRRDRSELVSRQNEGRGGERANGNVDAASISRSGRYVAFESSATNLSDKDGRGRDIFRRDVRKKKTRLVSLQSRSRGGKRADSRSQHPAISPDGRYVAFESAAENLSRADTNHIDDVYLRDIKRRTTELVSRQSAADGGAVQDPGAGSPFVEPTVLGLYPSVSAHGRYVAFHSTATNLNAEDIDGLTDSEDVFLRDIEQRTTELVSRRSDSEGGDPGNGDSYLPSASADGRFVAFPSDAGNLSDVDNPSPGFTDVFLRQVR
jgi:Tol biopolymer transport system component